MKCPDCGTHLSDIAIDGLFLYRCYRCGGFWSDSHTFSKINPHSLTTLRRVKIDPVWLKGGKGVCPLDGMALQVYINEDIPDTIRVKSCMRCGKLWYPGDSLFEQKLAGGVVESRPASAPRVLFLVVVGAFILAGVGSSVYLVRQPARTTTQAASEVAIHSLDYQDGNEEIIFESMTPVSAVAYKTQASDTWMPVGVEHIEGRMYRAHLQVVEGEVYEVEISGQTFNFEAK